MLRIDHLRLRYYVKVCKVALRAEVTNLKIGDRVVVHAKAH